MVANTRRKEWTKEEVTGDNAESQQIYMPQDISIRISSCSVCVSTHISNPVNDRTNSQEDSCITWP